MAKTLKDEIAMVALNGLLSLGERGTERLAKASYQYADAMVEERRKRQLAERKKDAPV
tara:strand:- start:3312 stop:3485 length:174 start_codon:yes stop_codon:yes gene_type:complete